ncbi:MAG: DUF1684 domain-containing protein, partial [Candidatus Krumholzibacteriia bacterium]
MRGVLAFLIVALLSRGVLQGEGRGGVAEKASTAYQDEIRAWRERRIARLTSDTGYLTLTGLFWLEAGESTFGSDPANKLVFAAHSAPARAGVFVHENGVTTVRAYPGTRLLHDGKPVEEMRMVSDTEGKPSVFTLGDLSFYLIERAGLWAIRVRDPNSKIRKEFHDIDVFPIDEAYRVTARFEPYDPPRKIPLANVFGAVDTLLSPGALVFTLHGQECRLDPVVESLTGAHRVAGEH